MTTKKFLWVSVVLAFSMFGTMAHAQNTNTLGSNSSTNTNTVATSGLQNEQNFITNNPSTIDYKGGFKTVPSAVIGAFSNSFSSDYCYGTAQLGASWLGASISGGKPVLDQGCELLRSSDMLMRISVQVRAEASNEYNLASHMQDVLTTNIKVQKHEESGDQLLQGALIRKMKDESYDKELKADMLETAAIYNVCSIGDAERANLESAGFKCPDKKK
jgi:hypothetical protein